MNPLARQHLIQRIREAPTLAALRTTWEGVNPEYQRDQYVREAKDKRKTELGG